MRISLLSEAFGICPVQQGYLATSALSRQAEITLSAPNFSAWLQSPETALQRLLQGSH